MCGVTESAGLVGEQRLIEAIVVEVIVVIAAEAAVGDFVNGIVNPRGGEFNSVLQIDKDKNSKMILEATCFFPGK